MDKRQTGGDFKHLIIYPKHAQRTWRQEAIYGLVKKIHKTSFLYLNLSDNVTIHTKGFHFQGIISTPEFSMNCLEGMFQKGWVVEDVEDLQPKSTIFLAPQVSIIFTDYQTIK